ncbi:hypothetical protein DUI87_04862 [Hirundo rustica rustica]|uniref:TopBP1/SLF1 BRCT domain-containing protein n=1 Tax=Hirundo rustica rustica TaxID=333673 RepID=A0A3M0LFV5_HIRRU|nr:hypothetical protein DUI87_04862 [Hirundo rustica rustica]
MGCQLLQENPVGDGVKGSAKIQMESGSQKRIIQLTGFKKQEKKALLKCLFKLNCVFIERKWVLTKEYIINSAESGRWLDETAYEWGYEIERDTHYSPQMQSAPKRWREELTNSSAPGAFHRWKVVLLVKRGDKRMACIRRPNPDKIATLRVNTTISSQEKAAAYLELGYIISVKSTDWSKGTWSILQGLVEEDLLHDVVTELSAGQMCSAPPVKLLHPLLEYVLLDFRSEVAGLLNAILGTVVDYWIISGLLMDRNVFHQVPDLAHYLAISCDDYAGWTPLHEACNHGSTVCVHEILERCPEVDLLSQVDGVTPLHDALSNGHVEIGKLLLQHGEYTWRIYVPDDDAAVLLLSQASPMDFRKNLTKQENMRKTTTTITKIHKISFTKDNAILLVANVRRVC